jgi:hypothetical protein
MSGTNIVEIDMCINVRFFALASYSGASDMHDLSWD